MYCVTISELQRNIGEIQDVALKRAGFNHQKWS